jgi:phosphatidylinositol alpha-1,6-mannosyltransferase
VPDALLVTSSFLPGRGGIESYLAALCDELSPRLAVLAPARRDGRAIPENPGYPTIGFPGSLLIPGPRVRRAIERAAREHGTDRVLFGTPWPLAMTGPRLRKSGLRYAVIIHGAEILVPAAVPPLRRTLGRALAEADLLLPVSEHTRRRVEQLLGRSGQKIPPTAVLRARVDAERFRPLPDAGAVHRKLGLEQERPLLLAFGRLVRRKGVHRLIGALPRIRERVPDAIAVVAGTGPQERRLRRLAARTSAPVIFTGRVPEEEAPSLYAAADAFVLPVADRWFGLEVEGLGVVLLEASACGTPCVTGRSGGTPEAVVDGLTGFVIDGRDDGALIDRTAALLEDRSRAAAMGARARGHVLTEFAGRPLPQALVDWLGA